MDISGWELSARVRELGWHCVWLCGAFSRISVGMTAESASSKALRAGLDAVSTHFNAVEVDTIRVAKYRGFCVARVTIHSRQIQQDATLSSPNGWRKEHHESQKVHA
jgi:hypothetical protein